ncbi:ATP-dependent 26S proteasome regulatory subunit, partial [Fusobacterium sp. PH5-29]
NTQNQNNNNQDKQSKENNKENTQKDNQDNSQDSKSDKTDNNNQNQTKQNKNEDTRKIDANEGTATKSNGDQEVIFAEEVDENRREEIKTILRRMEGSEGQSFKNNERVMPLGDERNKNRW